MADHGSQLVLVLRHGEDARVHAHLATGQCERIGFLVDEHRGLPPYATVLRRQLRDQRVHHALHVTVLAAVGADLFLLLGFGKRLRAQLVQLGLGDAAHHLPAPGRGRRGRAGADQGGDDKGQQQLFHGSSPVFMSAVCSVPA
ncbi:hypothetical protein G6F22_017562 [Rhizopus arrhizus]|nr:hypothetical protein G6F22_017562 [Rhizopus arrhizus]